MTTATNSYFFSRPPERYRDVFANPFDLPLQSQETFNNLISTINKIGLGIIAGAVTFIFTQSIAIVIYTILSAYDFPLKGQEAANDIAEIASLPPSPEATAIKVIACIFTVIIGPVIEEVVFRWGIHSLLTYYLPEDSTVHKTLRVVSNGLIFGACHIVPSQGWSNIPIFVGTSIGGMINSALKEHTGDIKASIAAHMTHNGIGVGLLLAGT